jgi:phage tail P2-like protein
MSTEVLVPVLQLATTAPDWMVTDANAGPAFSAIDGELNDFANDLQEIIIYGNLTGQPESILDYLAAQFNVPFYNQSFTASQKLSLIQNNFYFQSQLGTPAILQNLITTIFANAQVQEWWQYNGKPYHFKIACNGLSNNTQLAQATAIVQLCKNARSWFDGFATLTTVPSAPAYVDCGVFVQRFQRNPPWLPIAG